MAYPQYCPRFLRAADGGPPLIRAYREADSQQFVAGDLVYLNSGYAYVCADDATKILGMALEAASNVTTGHKMIDVMIMRPGDEWAIRTASGTTLTKLTGANVGIAYAAEYISSGLWSVDSSQTGADAFQCVKLLYDEDESTVDSSYYAVFTIIPSVAQYSQGA